MNPLYRTLPWCHYWADQTAGSLSIGIFEAGTLVEVLERSYLVKVTAGAVTGWVYPHAIEAVAAVVAIPDPATMWERLVGPDVV